MDGVMEQDYLAEWTCKCGKQLRAWFKAQAVRGPHFGEHTIICPDCKEPKSVVPKPYRLDRRAEGNSWTTVWVE